MPTVLEERLKKELFDIGTLSIKSNGEDVDISEAEKQPIETIDKNSIQVQYKDERVDNYFLEQIRITGSEYSSRALDQPPVFKRSTKLSFKPKG